MEKINIGVYRSDDPIHVSGEERLEAALREAEKNNIRLVFFNDDSIIFSQNMIRAQYKEKDRWRTIRTYIPEIVINPLPSTASNRTEIEKRLRKISRFTAYGVMGKYEVYKKLIESDEYKKYAIESIKVNDYREVFNSLDNHGKVILKPVDGRQGMGIYSIYRSKNNYIVLDDGKETTFREEHFKMFIDGLVGEGEHIVQPYIECLTKKGEPYDFRVHLHRGGKGEWVVVKSYPRIGSSKGILSNISRGGRTLEIDKFLEEEFGAKHKLIREEIESIAIDLADYINSFSINPINEIGVDIAIDKDGNYYTYELNGGPQSKYHEEERAKYVIEYAKYLYNEELEKRTENYLKYIGSELLKVESKLLNKDFEDEIYIGMMIHSVGFNYFALACSYIALENNVKFFFFRPEDVNFKEKTILGYYFDGDDLKTKKFIYPDVILDRYKNRPDKIYDEFKNIPITNTRKRGVANKSYIYKLLNEDQKIKKHIIPYISSDNIEELESFLEYNDEFIIKPNEALGGSGIELAKKLEDGFKLENNLLNKEEFIEYSGKRILNNYVLQKKIMSLDKKFRPIDVRIRLDKNGVGDWAISTIYGRVGRENKVASTVGGYHIEIDRFLKSNFSNSEIEINNIKSDLIRLSIYIANYIDYNIDSRICEMGIDVGIDEDGNYWIFEVNIGDPGMLLKEYLVAKNLVPYCIYLAKNNKEVK